MPLILTAVCYILPVHGPCTGLRLRIAGEKHNLFPGICFLDNKISGQFFRIKISSAHVFLKVIKNSRFITENNIYYFKTYDIKGELMCRKMLYLLVLTLYS